MKWIILVSVVVILTALALVSSKQAESKSVAMCGTINVPTKSGRCRRTTIVRFGKRYKVRVCL